MKKRVVDLCSVYANRQMWTALFGVCGALTWSTLPVLAEQDLNAVQDVPVASRQVAAGVNAIENNRVVLSLRSRRVYLYQGDILLSSYPVAIGTSETPTPQGEFTVSKMVENPVWQSPWTGEVHAPGPNSALGLRWIEFTSNDEGAFGFHGTPTVESIGYAASNGCVRMYNDDVVALFSQVQVGTPVSIVQ